VTRFAINRIEVLEAEEYERADIQDMIDIVWQLKQKYGSLSAIYVDAAMPVVWQPLKRLFNELANEDRIYGTPEYQGGFKALHDKGTIRITDYREDYPNRGSGRPERRKKE